MWWIYWSSRIMKHSLGNYEKIRDMNLEYAHIWYLNIKILFEVVSKERMNTVVSLSKSMNIQCWYSIHKRHKTTATQLTSMYVILIWEWKEFNHLIKWYTNQVDVVPLCIVTSPFLLIFELSHVPCLFGAICQQMPSIQNFPLNFLVFSMQLLFVFWYH